MSNKLKCSDHVGEISKESLFSWLVQEVPAINESYATIGKEDYDYEPEEAALSPYFMIAIILCPHIDSVLSSGDLKEVQRLFDILEILANKGSCEVANGVWFGMEDFERPKVCKFLGPTLRKQEFERVSSTAIGIGYLFFLGEERGKRIYRKRWRSEIEKIGGLEFLSIEAELIIRHRLKKKYWIYGLLAPEPGGEEWLEMDLMWPYPPLENESA